MFCYIALVISWKCNIFSNLIWIWRSAIQRVLTKMIPLMGWVHQEVNMQTSIAPIQQRTEDCFRMEESDCYPMKEKALTKESVHHLGELHPLQRPLSSIFNLSTRICNSKNSRLIYCFQVLCLVCCPTMVSNSFFAYILYYNEMLPYCRLVRYFVLS